MKEKLNIALLQYDIAWENPQQNFELILNLIQDIEADIFFLPEMFSYGFSMNVTNIAEPPNGISYQFLQEMALSKNACVTATIPTIETKRFYNRLYWVTPDKKNITYNKKHLFTLGKENQYYTAGTHQQIIECHGWRLLPQICYDLRFPVFSRNTAALQYDAVFYLANWPEQRDLHWQTLLRARAIENTAYSIGVNRLGKDAHKTPHSGNSMCINAFGKSLKNLSHKNNVLLFTLLASELEETRSSLPFLNDQDLFDIVPQSVS